MNRKKLPRAIGRTAADMRAAGASAQAQPPSAPAGNVVEMPPRSVAASPSAGDADGERSAAAARAARMRRAFALRIVRRHAALATAGGLIPLPFANVAAVTAAIVRMVKALSAHYRVPFERDRARAIAVGLLGGTMPTGTAAVTISTLGFVLPSANLFGIAVSSFTAAACTRAIGRFFVEHFESGATLADVPVPSSARGVAER